MVTIEMAKKIGITHCADSIGRTFVENNANNSTVAFSEENDKVFCFLGIASPNTLPECGRKIILSSRNCDAFPIKASCFVSLLDGSAQTVECVRP